MVQIRVQPRLFKLKVSCTKICLDLHWPAVRAGLHLELEACAVRPLHCTQEPDCTGYEFEIKHCAHGWLA